MKLYKSQSQHSVAAETVSSKARHGRKALRLPVEGFFICKVHMGIALEATAVSVCVQPHFGNGAVTHQLSEIVLAGLKCNVPNICNIVTLHLHPNITVP